MAVKKVPESEDLHDEMKVKLERRGRAFSSMRIGEYGGEHGEGEETGDDPFIVNLCPAHPIVHGILRLLLAVEGETIVAAVPELGYLHRGVEKSMESGNYHQVIPYTDRLNYASPMMNNIGYCKAVEKMLGIEISERDALLRVILCELGRIMDHLCVPDALGGPRGADAVLVFVSGSRKNLRHHGKILGCALDLFLRSYRRVSISAL